MSIGRAESATSGTDRALALGILLLVVAYLAVSIFTVNATRWIQDDTMIFLQYARNLANGDGLVFNIGERVRGITSPPRARSFLHRSFASGRSPAWRHRSFSF